MLQRIEGPLISYFKYMNRCKWIGASPYERVGDPSREGSSQTGIEESGLGLRRCLPRATVSAILRGPMANRAIWSMRKRHEWLTTPLKKKRVKRATRVRCGLQDAINRKTKSE